ncbi:MAG: hypothetical protein HY000_37845 [Planctomycetes bacterium]|nr:hypothetical protein [Planctomycetota bacterium]
MKRFVNIGGEMISLPAKVAAIDQAYPSQEGQIGLALTAEEQKGQRPRLCLFTTFDCTVEEVNRVLQRAGFSNLARVRRVQSLDEIPTLGSGKTDYRGLTDRLKRLTSQ